MALHAPARLPGTANKSHARAGEYTHPGMSLACGSGCFPGLYPLVGRLPPARPLYGDGRGAVCPFGTTRTSAGAFACAVTGQKGAAPSEGVPGNGGGARSSNRAMAAANPEGLTWPTATAAIR